MTAQTGRPFETASHDPNIMIGSAANYTVHGWHFATTKIDYVRSPSPSANIFDGGGSVWRRTVYRAYWGDSIPIVPEAIGERGKGRVIVAAVITSPRRSWLIRENPISTARSVWYHYIRCTRKQLTFSLYMSFINRNKTMMTCHPKCRRREN